jgi:hypothetical protein
MAKTTNDASNEQKIPERVLDLNNKRKTSNEKKDNKNRSRFEPALSSAVSSVIA